MRVLKFLAPLVVVGSLSCHPAIQNAEAQGFRFDMEQEGANATPATPVAEGYIGVTRQDAYDEARGYGWVKPPAGYFDYALTYPASDLDRDGILTDATRAVFGVKVPPGDYDVTVRMGMPSPNEWRPGHYVKVGDEYKVRGGMTGGNVLVSTFPVRSTGERLDFTIGAQMGNEQRGTALTAFEIVPAQSRSKTPGFTASASLRWLSTEKIRGLYAPSQMPAFDEKKGRYYNANAAFRREIKNSGMNALFTNFQGREGSLTEWAGWAKQNDLRLFDVSNFAIGPDYDEIAGSLRKVVYSDDRVDTKPCPLEERAWQIMVGDQAIKNIRHAKASGGRLDGLVIDTEMYGAKVAEVYNNNACYCAVCVTNFAGARKLTTNPGQGKAAFEALQKQGLLQEYFKHEEDRLTAIMKRVSGRIRREDPNFLLGFLQWKENFWYLRALTRGLGTPDVPTIIMSEEGYYGYNNDGERQKREIKAMGANAVYVPGLWFNQFTPRGLSGAAASTLSDAGGYWLYGVPALFEPQDPADQPPANRFLPHSYLVRPAGEYWNALKEANATLKKPASPALLSARNEPAMPGPRDWVRKAALPPIPDQHPTKLVDITPPAKPIHLFDMGIPDSPVREGFKPIYYNTLYDKKTGYGWLNRVTGSFDRPDATPLDALTRDGLMVSVDNTFRISVPNGKYEVGLVLGDMSPNEARPWQNVSINGKKVLKDALTNGGEYRVWNFPATVTNGQIDILFEAVGPQRDSVLALMIGHQ